MDLFYTVVVAALFLLMGITATVLVVTNILVRIERRRSVICPVCKTKVDVHWIHLTGGVTRVYVECTCCHRESYIRDTLAEATESLLYDPFP